MFRTGKIYDYLECGVCGTLRRGIEVVPDEMYPAEYYSIAHDPRAELGSGIKKFVSTILSRSAFSRYAVLVRVTQTFAPIKQLRTLSRMLVAVNTATRGLKVASILDVGTGSGYFPFITSLSGRKSIGIDPHTSQEWSDGNCAVKKMHLSEINEKFDLITFHHSLEHVTNPREILYSAKALLNPNGVVVVRVPKRDSRAWQDFKTSWFQLDAPRHEFIPTSLGLHALSKDAGMQVVAEFDDSSAVQIWLSEYVRNGVSQMDEGQNYAGFRRDNSSILSKVSHSFSAWKRNRLKQGDQTVIIMKAA